MGNELSRCLFGLRLPTKEPSDSKDMFAKSSPSVCVYPADRGCSCGVDCSGPAVGLVRDCLCDGFDLVGSV